jgi:hypothetical protein
MKISQLEAALLVSSHINHIGRYGKGGARKSDGVQAKANKKTARGARAV